MSWSDDIRCLYCDGKLPLYRKITSGQFCNSAHRKAYWQEQERLAVERLSQTHDSLRAYRPPAAVEAIPGRVPEPAPYFDTVPESGHLPLPRLLPSAEMPPGFVVADPLAYDMDEGAWHPHRVDWKPKINIDDRIPMTGLMRGWTRPLPRWMVDRLATEPLPLNVTRAPICPMPAFGAGAYLRNADVVELRLADEIAPSRAIAGAAEPVETRTAPVWRLSLSIPPQSNELRALLDEQAPQCERFFTLARPLACATLGKWFEVERQPLPIAITMRPQIPLAAAALHAQLAPATLVQPGLRALAVDLIPRVQGAWIDSLRAVDPQLESDTPQFALTTPARRPRLQLAAGSRFAVRTRTAPAPIAESTTETFTAPPADVSMPQRNARTTQAQAAQPAAAEMPVPSPRGLLPLPCLAPVNDLLAAQAALSIPQPPRTEMMRPASKLEPLDEKPVSDFMPAPAMPAPATTNVLFGMPEPPVKPEHRVHVWTHAIDFWKNAPRDLKMLAFAIPVLLWSRAASVAPQSAGGRAGGDRRGSTAGRARVKHPVAECAAVHAGSRRCGAGRRFSRGPG